MNAPEALLPAVADEQLAAEALINEGGSLRQPRLGDFSTRHPDTPRRSFRQSNTFCVGAFCFGLGAMCGWLARRH